MAKSGLLEHYQAEREGADRIENLDELVNAAAAFNARGASRVESRRGSADPLTAFLTHAALEAGEHQAGEGQDALQLMTVHSAKGLEFNAVFVSGLEEGLFPHEHSLLEKDGLEEERRLMYVAITRAREAPVPVVRADAHAARPDALQPALALHRRDSAGPAQVAHAALRREEEARGVALHRRVVHARAQAATRASAARRPAPAARRTAFASART